MEYIGGERIHYSFLDVVGVLGHFGEPEVPYVEMPILAERGTGRVIIPPYDDEGLEIVLASDTYIATKDEFAELLWEENAPELDYEPFAATMFDAPIPARPESTVYVVPGTGHLEYITLTAAWERISRFVYFHRQVGDDLFRSGDVVSAERSYLRAASASHEPDDFARLLVCGAIDEYEKNLFRSMIEKQGKDPDVLQSEMREFLVRGDK